MPWTASSVETLRKPSTGLKHTEDLVVKKDLEVETLRKPSTGLKQNGHAVERVDTDGRDTQKTQHGIETSSRRRIERLPCRVETLRKPSTGLKPPGDDPVGLNQQSRHSENPARD